MRALISDIIRHAAHLSGLKPSDITGPSKLRSIVRIRQAVCLIAREQVREDGPFVVHAHSYPQIGLALGDRDHSTIIHSCATAEVFAKRDPAYAKFIADLRNAAGTGRIFANPARSVAVATVPVPQFHPRVKPAAIELERFHDGGQVYTLDHNGDCKEGRTSKVNIPTASARLAAAINQARAA